MILHQRSRYVPIWSAGQRLTGLQNHRKCGCQNLEGSCCFQFRIQDRPLRVSAVFVQLYNNLYIQGFRFWELDELLRFCSFLVLTQGLFRLDQIGQCPPFGCFHSCSGRGKLLVRGNGTGTCTTCTKINALYRSRSSGTGTTSESLYRHTGDGGPLTSSQRGNNSSKSMQSPKAG